VEFDRSRRMSRRNGAKPDKLDPLPATREALPRKHLAQPRRRANGEAVGVLLSIRNGTIEDRTESPVMWLPPIL